MPTSEEVRIHKLCLYVHPATLSLWKGTYILTGDCTNNFAEAGM